MIRARRPTAGEVERYRRAQRPLDFTYEAVGATAASPPRGFVVDRHAVELGSGQACFERARAALFGFAMFDLGWVEAHPEAGPVRPGLTVVVLVRAFGLWFENAARVVYVVDEDSRAGFAYGTLPGHAESGEERFGVERDARGTVRYDLLAFSRPHTRLARLARPCVRALQRRFARDSLHAMQRAVADARVDQSDFLFR